MTISNRVERVQLLLHRLGQKGGACSQIVLQRLRQLATDLSVSETGNMFVLILETHLMICVSTGPRS